MPDHPTPNGTSSTASGAMDEVLAEVAAIAPDGRGQVVVDFAEAALRRVPANQLRQADRRLTARQLVDAFTVADERRADELAIRVFTPEVALDGWSNPGTVIQIASEDRPFLLSTVTEELELRGLELVRSLHPIVGVRRDGDGRIQEVLPARTAEERESFLHIELDAVLGADDALELSSTLERLLSDVTAATRDYEAMCAQVRAVADRLRREPPPGVDPEQSVETAALLSWLLDENFVLLGTREYEVIPGNDGRDAVRVKPGSGLGVLTHEASSRFATPVAIEDLEPDFRRRVTDTALLTMSRTNRLSTVHRRARMDYVGIKRIGPDGTARGEFRVVGLFTRKGYTEPARTTPVLRRKLSSILEREDVVPGSYDEITLISLFQALPKDELFQASEDDLHELLLGLFHAEEHRETRVMTRVDHVTRTVSVLVAVPRDRYNPQLRQDLQTLFLERFGGDRVDVDLSLGDRAEALVRFNVQIAGDTMPDVRPAALEREVRALARSWIDDVMVALTRRYGDADGKRLARRFAERLPRSYRDATPPGRALDDIALLDQVDREDLELAVVLQPAEPGKLVRLKAAQHGDTLELSSFIPILESLGLTVVEEIPYVLEGDGPAVSISDFGVRASAGGSIDVATDGPRLAEATIAAWRGQVEVDSMNRVILTGGLTWQQVSVLRAYRRYRRQVGTAYTAEYVNETLASHPAVVAALLAYFDARFSPAVDVTEEELAVHRQRVIDRCDEVERLDHDRIMRSFLSLMDATLRTNAFRDDATAERPDGRHIPYLSFKIDPWAVPDIPRPVPYREIFVYSPLVEGIHLRGGPVARGGLRWSDRQDDVRTEVLGLLKAQILKNAVIVPTGAKGGFVVKRPPADRGELRAEVERQYVTFVRGLLDLTDNLAGGDVVPPPDVRRHDGDDPYLVVAADKGTATFSDLANSVAADYDFWLGDAFASGGSRGYDHKALGITARGAWLAVRRHFRELGIDTQTEPISVVGIGDMSGDVFGNGMLASRTIRLVAAFDHRDILIDPDPDAAAMFEERKRLYDTAGSTWQDIDRALLSEGGGVWSRDTKMIELNGRIRELLRIEDTELPPDELIQAILRAPVDLLWAGGIGTYVKASEETHDDIGDRANDELRVDADELRARVIGEGANLSITQRARVQYARRGGRLNQDAVDNAAGVDISDHEVNVKILLGVALEDGLIDVEERDRLLAAVTDDIVEHVLTDVDRQTWVLSQEVRTSVRALDQYEAVMRTLEDEVGLDREIEALPDPAEMAQRAEAGAGLGRPELATLVASVKRVLAADLLASDLPDQPAFQPTLRTYFPPLLVERFEALLPRHRLRRELIAMAVANDIVNRLGVTFVFRLAGETGVPRARVVAAYWAARAVADADRAWRGLESLATILDPDRQLSLKQGVDETVAELTRAYLGDATGADVEAVIDRDAPVVEAFRGDLMQVGTDDQRRRRVDRANTLMDDLVDPDLAAYLATSRDLTLGPDVAAVFRGLGPDSALGPSAITDAFLRLASALGVDRLRRVLDRIEPEGRWSRWQHGGLLGDLREVQRAAVARTLREEPSLAGPDAVQRFLTRRDAALRHAIDLIRDVESDEEPTLDAVSVAVRAIRTALDEQG
ncbi:MAG: NAD-glutamate dehydrogenase [Actinobacteria bacterium]|nr:NAD-glutamate dehydrogenase [Actinomycetota bacterium]